MKVKLISVFEIVEIIFLAIYGLVFYFFNMENPCLIEGSPLRVEACSMPIREFLSNHLLSFFILVVFGWIIFSFLLIIIQERYIFKIKGSK